LANNRQKNTVFSDTQNDSALLMLVNSTFCPNVRWMLESNKIF